MAPHSSTLAWKIPWTEEPGRLQSMGLWRVGLDWVTSLSLSLSCIGEGTGNPVQCSCLENPRDGGAWWAAIYGVTQSRTWLKRLSSTSSSSWIIKNKIKQAWALWSSQASCCYTWYGNSSHSITLHNCLHLCDLIWSTFGRTCYYIYITEEKKMATHSSVLAWRIPGTGEPGGLPSLGSQGVGHDWSDLAAAAAVIWYVFYNILELTWNNSFGK